MPSSGAMLLYCCLDFFKTSFKGVVFEEVVCFFVFFFWCSGPDPGSMLRSNPLKGHNVVKDGTWLDHMQSKCLNSP